nr:leucine zipper domain-containing protein [Actinacidiphila soli]
MELSRLHRREVLASHRNARLTVHGRWLLVERVREGDPGRRQRSVWCMCSQGGESPS